MPDFRANEIGRGEIFRVETFAENARQQTTNVVGGKGIEVYRAGNQITISLAPDVQRGRGTGGSGGGEGGGVEISYSTGGIFPPIPSSGIAFFRRTTSPADLWVADAGATAWTPLRFLTTNTGIPGF